MQTYFQQVGSTRLRVASTLSDNEGIPLLVFNGIGAGLEVLEPFLRHLPVPSLLFDMPGVGGSQGRGLPMLPGRMSYYANLANQFLEENDIETANIMGVSWGGALAQEFSRRYRKRCHKLILAATSTGQISMPPRLSVMLHMATPLRYLNPNYFKNIAGDLYGGDFRTKDNVRRKHTKRMTPPATLGYLQQLTAMIGWTSVFWLHDLDVETLVMAGEDDPIIPMMNARFLARRLPNARLETFDCGHLFLLTRREKACELITNFLD